MATNTQLKFYKLGANESMPTTGLVTGAIYFVPKEGVIRVATSATTSEPYGGKLSNAEWDSTKLKLTISKYDGSSLELDFSDMASSSAVTAALNTINSKIDTIEASVGLDADGKFKSNAKNYGGDAKTIGDEIKNVDMALKALSNNVNNMATSEVVESLTTRVTTAESDIDALQEVVSDYSGNGAIKNAIAAAQSAATTTIGTVKDEEYIEIIDTFGTGEGKTANHAYIIKTKGVAKASELSALTTTVNEHITKDFASLDNKVTALSSATHFEGVVTWNPSTVSISGPVDGNFTIEGKPYQSGDIVIYKPTGGGSKEYILDGPSKTFIELGDTTATDAAVSAIDTRVGALESWKPTISANVESLGNTKLDKSVYTEFIGDAGEFGTLKSSVATTNTANDTRFGKIDSITGHPSVDGSKVTAGYQKNDNTEYIKDATSLNDADVKLDAAIKALSERVKITEGEVASVEGDSSTIQVTTDTGVATVSAITGNITKDAVGLAKAADVYSALCWVEFN